MPLELKPCPFCGSEAEVRYMGMHLAIASCTKCSCVQQVYSRPASDTELSEEDYLREAAAMWNKEVKDED